MKRILLLLALCVASSSTLSANGSRPEATERKGMEDCGLSLYGDIESLTVKNYDVSLKFGEIVLDDMNSMETFTFNHAGDLQEMTTYNTLGEIDERLMYSYDEDRKMLDAS